GGEAPPRPPQPRHRLVRQIPAGAGRRSSTEDRPEDHDRRVPVRVRERSEGSDRRDGSQGKEREKGGLTRRGFLGAGVVRGALALTGPALPRLAAAGAAEGKAGDREAPPALELAEATIAELQAGMQAGRHTARSLTESYLGRIEALNLKGPELRHVLE